MKLGNVISLLGFVLVAVGLWKLYQAVSYSGLRTVRTIDPLPAPITLQSVDSYIPLVSPDGSQGVTA